LKSELIAGDTLQFDTVVPDYPAGDGWTLTYKLVPRVAGTTISFNAAADGDDYAVEVGSTTTATWTAGEYSWAAYVSLSGERHTVDSGTCTINADPAAASTLDSRTHARVVLEAIEAVIESRATKDQQEYTIGNRTLKRIPIMELVKFAEYYRAKVKAEDNAAAGISSRLVARL
jgi:hypothetical protein